MYLPPLHGAASTSSSSSVSFNAKSSFADQAKEIPAAIGADSFTPAHLIEASSNLLEIPAAIGADTITPAYLAEKEAASSSIQVVEQINQNSIDFPAPIGADTFTPAHLEEQSTNQFNVEAPVAIGADTITPAYLAEKETAPSSVVEQEAKFDFPAPIGADSFTPAHLIEKSSFKAEESVHAPVETKPTVLFGDAPAHGEAEYSAEASAPHHEHHAASGIDTQYGSNGGYVY